MATILGMDQKIVFGTSLAVTSGIALYSTLKYLSLAKQKKDDDVYETKKYLNDYLIFHYGQPNEILKWPQGPKDSLDFPKRCADLCLKHFSGSVDGVPSRALDIGCAVGRSSFELTRKFEEVVGIDYSHSFVAACDTMKGQGQMAYEVITEGDLTMKCIANIDTTINRSRAVFQQGDACNLSLDLGRFGCVLAANLICRLHSPRSFFDRLPSLVAPGGILVITSPYTFLREFTARENWIGAYNRHGEDLTAFEGMKELLLLDFDLIAQEDMPFFIRETARKNQWTVAHATVWRRKQDD
jgi:putative 4-mercaptohistidine N1-methyltranferase